MLMTVLLLSVEIDIEENSRPIAKNNLKASRKLPKNIFAHCEKTFDSRILSELLLLSYF